MNGIYNVTFHGEGTETVQCEINGEYIAFTGGTINGNKITEYEALWMSTSEWFEQMGDALIKVTKIK